MTILLPYWKCPWYLLSLSALCKWYHSFLLFQWNFCYEKRLGFCQFLNEVSLAAKRASIILELISERIVIFRAEPWKRTVVMAGNNYWMNCSCIFFCPCENPLWLSDVFTFILLFSAQMCCSHLACDHHFSIYSNSLSKSSQIVKKKFN